MIALTGFSCEERHEDPCRGDVNHVPVRRFDVRLDLYVTDEEIYGLLEQLRALTGKAVRIAGDET